VDHEIADLQTLVVRMELYCSKSDDPHAHDLMQTYRSLVPHFEQGITDPRDVAISKAAALMLVKALLEPILD